jgi:hypothetical protein
MSLLTAANGAITNRRDITLVCRIGAISLRDAASL